MVTRAAEGTNGLTEKDKIQNISEITFGLATTMPRLVHSINRNNVRTEELHQKVDELESKLSTTTTEISTQLTNITELVKQAPAKRDIANLDWIDTLKLVLVKPWVWIFGSIICFSPKGIELVTLIINHFSN